MGFCFFNNVAIAALAALSEPDVKVKKLSLNNLSNFIIIYCHLSFPLTESRHF